MKLTDKATIIFKNSLGDREELVITINEMLELTKEHLYDLLEDRRPCNSSSCHNESQNFCDCGSNFEDYEIDEVFLK